MPSSGTHIRRSVLTPGGRPVGPAYSRGCRRQVTVQALATAPNSSFDPNSHGRRGSRGRRLAARADHASRCKLATRSTPPAFRRKIYQLVAATHSVGRDGPSGRSSQHKNAEYLSSKHTRRSSRRSASRNSKPVERFMSCFSCRSEIYPVQQSKIDVRCYVSPVPDRPARRRLQPCFRLICRHASVAQVIINLRREGRSR